MTELNKDPRDVILKPVVSEKSYGLIDEGKYTFRVPIDQDMAVARKFNARGVPMTYVIDRNGAIVAQGFGPINLDSSAFRNFIKAVAARKS